MKKISFLGRSGLQKRAFLTLPALFLAQSAMGVITLHIVEEGTDVRVSFSGTLDVDPTLVTQTSLSGGTPLVILNSSVGLVSVGDPITEDLSFSNAPSLGAAPPSSLDAVMPMISDFGSVSFGYFCGFIGYSESDISGGMLGAVSQITVDPADTFLVIPNTSVAAVLGATSADGDTLWRANTTNDTIVLSTSPPVVVPEPSSLMLAGMSFLGLLGRRRR